MYAILHIDEVRKYKNRPEVCTMLPSDVTKFIGLLSYDEERYYRIISIDPYGRVQHVCRADRWTEPDLSSKRL